MCSKQKRETKQKHQKIFLVKLVIIHHMTINCRFLWKKWLFCSEKKKNTNTNSTHRSAVVFCEQTVGRSTNKCETVYLVIVSLLFIIIFLYIFCFVAVFLWSFLNPTIQLEMLHTASGRLTVSVQRMQISKKRYLQFFSSTPTPHVTMTHRFWNLNGDIQFRARIQILMNDDDNYKWIV